MLHREVESTCKLKTWACCKPVSTYTTNRLYRTNRAVLEATKDYCCYFSLFAVVFLWGEFSFSRLNEVTGTYPRFVNCVYGYMYIRPFPLVYETTCSLILE